jgi:hypothetical protein
MTDELDDFVSDFCDRLKAWAGDHPELDEDGKASLMQFLHIGADKLLLLAQALDGR